jgi:hypothetical protein
MTASSEWSGRWSDRVDPQADPASEFAGLYGGKGPESMTPPPVHRARTGQRATRVATRALLSIDRDLSDRDRAILSDLDRFRFLTTGQIQTLHFHDHATEHSASHISRRVLSRLHQLRVIEHLERRIGGVRAGSASYVWRVGAVGDRLLRQSQGDDVRGRRKEPSARHLDHVLTIADCACKLVAAGRAGQLEVIGIEPEPDSWRRYLGAGGVPETLKPDLAIVTATGEYEDHWFVEIDRATESVPTVLKKCTQYERYRRTGREQADGGVFPLVLWIVPDGRRAKQLAAGIRSSREVDGSLFRVATTDQFLALILGQGATE